MTLGRPGHVNSQHKGQVALPKAIRDELRLLPGSRVDFEIEVPGKIVMRKRVNTDAFRKWQGYLKGKLPVDSVDELMELMRGERLPPDGEPSEDGA